MNRSYLILIALIALTSGCSNHEGVAPSQNSSLNTVSPSGTATSQGGSMQRSLDSWLKDEWMPMTAPGSSATTTTAPDGKAVTTTTAAEPVNEAPFTLQTYADKWKVYHENKAKMNEGKPKEISNIEKLDTMPVIGK